MFPVVPLIFVGRIESQVLVESKTPISWLKWKLERVTKVAYKIQLKHTDNSNLIKENKQTRMITTAISEVNIYKLEWTKLSHSPEVATFLTLQAEEQHTLFCSPSNM